MKKIKKNKNAKADTKIIFTQLLVFDKNNKPMRYTYKQLRKSTNLSQEKIAKIIGITKSSYNRIENYKTTPRYETFMKYQNNFLLHINLNADNVIINKPNKKVRENYNRKS